MGSFSIRTCFCPGVAAARGCSKTLAGSTEVRQQCSGLDSVSRTASTAGPTAPPLSNWPARRNSLEAADLPPGAKLVAWREAVRERVAPDPVEGVWPVGQDLFLAAGLAERSVTVAGIVRAMCERSGKQLESAHRLRHLSEGSPLAKAHGTKYPILQGPMTRVSDTAAFAAALADEGALPSLDRQLLRHTGTEQP